ncbi:MAG: 3-isopropylmalate dehydratase small subunit [Gammaproteobacteria bacterium]|nr:3-isopropylmalate dehydratase small subunit [Gammaproteobacteria bacterium]MYB37375.1 3-isopropylmalate dehydratase small subunit [Gammaproteobacteria bacterium]
MVPLTVHSGVAVPLLRANVDTDAIIPSREVRRVSRTGLGDGLFANWRYVDGQTGRPDPEFVLNRPERAGASILLGGPNFGCGSSREYAVWALAEFGIRVIVAPDFGPIFRKNCVANGLLPAGVPMAAVRELAAWSDRDPQHNRLTVDLVAARIKGAGEPVPFDVSRAARIRLLRGLDDIAMTDCRAAAIDAFEAERFAAEPWVRLP